MKRFGKILLIVIAVLLVLLIALVQRTDRTPVEQSQHYAEWQNWIQEHSFQVHTGPTAVGWAKAPITPDFSTPMSGYGKRKGAHYQRIQDSLYVRALSIRSPQGFISFVSADLLIIPPNVTTRLGELLENDGISLDELHLGATHTHHSLGGWGEKLLGRLFAGKFDERVEQMLAEQMRQVILASRQNTVPAAIHYEEVLYPEGVKNRLKVANNEVVDSEIRSLLVDREDGQRAMLLTYSAHATVLHSDTLALSRDFPGYVVDSLENHEDLDFALYFAGAVGSMGHVAEGETPLERARRLGTSLAGHVIDQVLPETDTLTAHRVDTALHLLSTWARVPLPAATLPIDLQFALRPWVFNALFGSSPGDIKITLLGHTLVLGMPADFSGEIMVELDQYARSQGLDLIITSFNGNYMGYITHDKHADQNMYESVTMAWNGYQAGTYYTRVAKDIIDRIAMNFNQ